MDHTNGTNAQETNAPYALPIIMPTAAQEQQNQPEISNRPVKSKAAEKRDEAEKKAKRIVHKIKHNYAYLPGFEDERNEKCLELANEAQNLQQISGAASTAATSNQGQDQAAMIQNGIHEKAFDRDALRRMTLFFRKHHEKRNPF